MPKQIQITIPEPCQEKWEEMTPTQQGAYCQVCSKNVVDFTSKTENEIYYILTQSDGNTCGRFTSFQLQNPIRKTEVNNGWFNWRAIAASLAALVAFEETTKASGNTQKVSISIETAPVKYNGAEEGPEDEINGVVLDAETHVPIPYADLVWRDDRSAVSTDFEGRFILVDPDHHKNSLVVVRAIGYYSLEIDVNNLKDGHAILLYKKEHMKDIISIASGKVAINKVDMSSERSAPKVITGRVLDAKTKEPLYSASVYCKNDRTIGAVTDASGGFTLQVDSVAHKSDIIVVQYLGYSTYEIPIAEFYKNGAAITMEISMAEAIMGLSVVELPSTIYGKLKKTHRLSKRRQK